MEGKHYVYIAICKDNSLYTGMTKNLIKREKRHNDGYGAHYTKIRRPIKIIYYETFNNIKEAAKREKQIKGWSKNKKINLMKYGHPNPKK